MKFFYVENENYIKNLGKENNKKKIEEKVKKNNKKCFFILLILFFLIILLFFKEKFYLLNIIFLLFLYFSIIINVNKNMLNYYYNFILLCKEILKFEKNFKDINKIIKYNPNIKNDIENIFNDFLLEINKILNEKNNNNKNDYEKYLKLKIKIFNLIFDEFENFYCKNKNFINVFI